MRLRVYYGIDPKGQGFYWPKSDQKRDEYFALKRVAPYDAEAIYGCNPTEFSGSIFTDKDFVYYQMPPFLEHGIHHPVFGIKKRFDSRMMDSMLKKRRHLIIDEILIRKNRSGKFRRITSIDSFRIIRSDPFQSKILISLLIGFRPIKTLSFRINPIIHSKPH